MNNFFVCIILDILLLGFLLNNILVCGINYFLIFFKVLFKVIIFFVGEYILLFCFKMYKILFKLDIVGFINFSMVIIEFLWVLFFVKLYNNGN